MKHLQQLYKLDYTSKSRILKENLKHCPQTTLIFLQKEVETSLSFTEIIFMIYNKGSKN